MKKNHFWPIIFSHHKRVSTYHRLWCNKLGKKDTNNKKTDPTTAIIFNHLKHQIRSQYHLPPQHIHLEEVRSPPSVAQQLDTQAWCIMQLSFFPCGMQHEIIPTSSPLSKNSIIFRNILSVFFGFSWSLRRRYRNSDILGSC